MPYAVKLKSAVYPPAKLRDGVGRDSPMRTLSEAYDVVFHTLPPSAIGDPSIEYRQVLQSETADIESAGAKYEKALAAELAQNQALSAAKLAARKAPLNAVPASPPASPVKPKVKQQSRMGSF